MKIFISYFVRLLGIFLVIFSLMATYNGISSLSNLSKEGYSGLSLSPQKDQKFLLVKKIIEDSPASHMNIQAGDTIIKFNSTMIDENFKMEESLNRKFAGEKVTFTFLKDGKEKDIEMILAPTSSFDKLVTVLFSIIPVFLMMLYVIVGLWGVFKSPYSRETILIALFCFCFGCIMYATISTGYSSDTFLKKYLLFDSLKSFISYIMWFGPSFWLLLFSTFPMENRFYQKNKFLSILFIFLLPIMITLIMILQIKTPIYFAGILILVFLNMTLGVLLLSNNAKHVTTALERRQIRLMLFGIKWGALSIGIGWIVVLISQLLLTDLNKNIVLLSFLVFLFGEISGLIIPFTFLNSFFQNRLLETESALKRKVRYTLVTFSLLSFYLFIIFLIVRFSITILDVQDPSLIIILVLFLSLTFTPINKKILRWVDEKFYPEKTIYSNSLKQYIKDISSYIEPESLFERLTGWIQNTMGITTIIPAYAESSIPDLNPFRVNEPDSVINKIKNGNIFYWDEVSEKTKTKINHAEYSWIKDKEISMTIPMLSHGELVGLLNIGKKENREDFTPEDLEILTQVSHQTALALHNLKLQSVFIEKKRIDKELEVARNIQKRLMPYPIPEVNSMEIYGESYPCNEVAGDYFDIINLEDGNTVFVIADVSGKGAGAAMIMANLQASIRLGIHLSDKFADFVTRINNLIYNNTSSSEFITFFMGIWVPEEKKFYYVNAGHNPPFILRKNNEILKLDATGIILGILPEQKYEVKSISMQDADILVTYTDGLEEAMNKSDELYGIERIINTVQTSSAKDVKMISKKLIEDVLEFCDGKNLGDDVTLIISKVIF